MSNALDHLPCLCFSDTYQHRHHSNTLALMMGYPFKICFYKKPNSYTLSKTNFTPLFWLIQTIERIAGSFQVGKPTTLNSKMKLNIKLKMTIALEITLK